MRNLRFAITTITYLLLSVLVASTTTAKTTAQLENEKALYRSSVEFYDPVPVNCVVSSTLIANNALAIWSYYRAKGLGETQTAGILGNYYVETGGTFDPKTTQIGGGKGRGIAQWEIGGRWDKLISYAEAREIDPYDLQTQLDFSWFELTGEPSAPGLNGGAYKKVYDKLVEAETVEDAAVIFGNEYEIFGLALKWRKGEVSYDKAFGERIKRAEEAFSVYSGTSVSVPNVNTSGCGYANAGVEIVGNPLETSANIDCYPKTVDLGIHDGYVSGEKVPMRLCALPNLPSTSAESIAGSAYYIEGANGMAIVNSRVSGAWYSLVDKALSDGVDLAAYSSFRTYEHQAIICGGCDGKKAARPGYSPHQSGVAIDFSGMGDVYIKSANSCSNKAQFNSDAYRWMEANANAFGFKQYVRESWHWDAINNSYRC